MAIRATTIGSLLALLATLCSACNEIPPEADGTNIFPFYRSAHYKGNDDYELDILWPLFHVSHVRERDTFRIGLFHTESMPDVYHDTWYLWPLVHAVTTPWRNELVVAPLFGYRERGATTHYDLVPFLIDSVASITTESGSFAGMRLLLEEADWGKAGTQVKLIDLWGLAHLLDVDTSRVTFAGGPTSVAPGYAVSVGKVLELVRLFGWNKEGAYRDVRFLEVLGSETFSLFRSQRRLDGSPQAGQGETHLAPFFFSGRDDSSSYTHLWPLFGVRNEGDSYHKYYFFYPVFAIEGDPVTDRSGFELLWPLIDYERAQQQKTLELLFVPIRWGRRQEAPAASPTSVPASPP
ncbi:MAG: hypothetical protein U1E76_03440 [Planctomycetota bacterium]